jgi:hypothetical protein
MPLGIKPLLPDGDRRGFRADARLWFGRRLFTPFGRGGRLTYSGKHSAAVERQGVGRTVRLNLGEYHAMTSRIAVELLALLALWGLWRLSRWSEIAQALLLTSSLLYVTAHQPLLEAILRAWFSRRQCGSRWCGNPECSFWNQAHPGGSKASWRASRARRF